MKPYTLKQFIDYVHIVDCLNTTMPAYTVPKRKYSVTKRKQVEEKISRLMIDRNGVPWEHVEKKKVTKEIHDTNGITKLILDYLRYVYGSSSVRRISSEGKYRPGVGFIPSSNKGMSDIEGIIYGKFLSLEIKVGKDSIRESQKERQIEVESDGGIYYLCKWVDFDQFQREIQQLIPIQ
jgi:hypothetical protein